MRYMIMMRSSVAMLSLCLALKTQVVAVVADSEVEPFVVIIAFGIVFLTNQLHSATHTNN